jgi:putative membrane protein (TIGR04086 family)
MLFGAFFSMLLKVTSLQETSMDFVFTVTSFLIILFGGLVSGGKAKEKGLIVGGLAALGFSLIVFLIQYLGYDQMFSMEQWLTHLGYLGTSAVGGILGVNMRSN